MATKHVRTSFGEPLIIDGKYRVTVVRKGRNVEWVVETVEWIDGQPVYSKTTDSLEILIDAEREKGL